VRTAPFPGGSGGKGEIRHLQHAAAVVSLATASAVIGRLLLGVLLGDADRHLVAAGGFVIQACGVLLLAIGTRAALLAVGCVLFGLGIGNLLTLPPLIAQREFPSDTVPRVVALVTAVNQAVFAFAPAVLGILRAVFHGIWCLFWRPRWCRFSRLQWSSMDASLPPRTRLIHPPYQPEHHHSATAISVCREWCRSVGIPFPVLSPNGGW
jgi:hypothetical protein